MIARPVFDRTRSAAIRDALIERIQDQPAQRRRIRTRIAVIVAIVLALTATGTAAVALVGGLGLLRSSAPAPAPVTNSPAPSPSATATALATPTVQAPAPVIVATTPIAPTDVLSAPAAPKWSLTLPGDNEVCVQHQVVDVNAGLALIQIGPKIIGDSAAGCTLEHAQVSLSLVDTRSGTSLWNREWTWDASTTWSINTETMLLGTSGRVLVNSGNDGSGPNEVLDLGTGAKLADFVPPANEGLQLQPVVGDSGDVVALVPHYGDQSRFLVQRFDPRRADAPIWSTPEMPMHWVSMQNVGNDFGYTSLTYSDRANTAETSGVLDLATGAFTVRSERVQYAFYSGFTLRPSAYKTVGVPAQLNGLDDDGNVLWTAPALGAGSVAEVLGPEVIPGDTGFTSGSARPVGTGQFLEIAAARIALVDGLTGATAWTADASGCGFSDDGYNRYLARVVPSGRAIDVFAYQGPACRFDRATGARVGNGLSLDVLRARGARAAYTNQNGSITAYDFASTAPLWSVSATTNDLFYAGGYLIALNGTTISRVG